MTQLTDIERQNIGAEIFAGNKIQAIKLYRNAVPGPGLTEAKQVIEQMEEELRTQHPDNFTALPRKSGCLGVGVGVLLLLAAVAMMMSILGQ